MEASMYHLYALQITSIYLTPQKKEPVPLSGAPIIQTAAQGHL